MSLDALIQELWTIKGNRTFQEMADEAGIVEVTLWRIMNRKRNPGTDTLLHLCKAYPRLQHIFLQSDIPDGNS